MRKSSILLSVVIIITGVLISYYIYFKKQTLESTCAMIKTKQKYDALVCQTNEFRLFKNLGCKYVIVRNREPSCLNNYSILFYITNAHGYVFSKGYVFIFNSNQSSFLKTKNNIFECKRIYNNIFECKKGKETFRLRIL